MSTSSSGICALTANGNCSIRRARELGVVFIHYRLADLPQVEEADGRLKITVLDQVLGKPVSLMVDLLTLATAIIPHNNAPLAELYKVPLNAEGFFMEAHAKIKPVEASTEGIYLTGLCHYPKPIQESVAEALACASRATTVLSKETLLMDSIISTPVDANCDGCAFCVDACPYPRHHAGGIHERRRNQEDHRSQRHPVQGLRLVHGHLSQAGRLRGRVHAGTVGGPGGCGVGLDLSSWQQLAVSQNKN